MQNEKLKNGYLTEKRFIIACMEKDIVVSKPVSNTEPYDFIVENKVGELFRIQVKKSWVDSKGRQIACLKSSYPRSSKTNIASKNERVDYICVLSKDGWYNIPRKEIQNITSNISVSKSGKRFKYLNNFDFQEIT